MLPGQTLDLIFLLIMGVIILSYTFRGFFASLFSLVQSLLVFFLTYTFGGRIAAWLSTAGFSEQYLTTPIREGIRQRLHSLYLSSTEGFDVTTIQKELPSFLVNSETAQKLSSIGTTGEELVDSATEVLTSTLMNVVFNVLGYLLVLIIVGIVVAVLARIIEHFIKHITFLKVVNRLLGAVIGAAIAVLLAIVAASVLKFFFAETPMVTDSTVIRIFAGDTILSIFRFLDFGSLFHLGVA